MGGVGAETRGLGEAVCVSPGAGLRVEVPWQLRRSEGPPWGVAGASWERVVGGAAACTPLGAAGRGWAGRAFSLAPAGCGPEHVRVVVILTWLRPQHLSRRPGHLAEQQ